MKYTKDDIFSLVGTVGFHALILLLLWFTVLKTIVPDEEEGILVNFGNLNAAAGTFEPRYTGEISTPVTPPPTPPQANNQQEELITQDQEESVALNNAQREAERREEERKKREEAEKERLRREEAERVRLAEEQRRREQEISNRVAGAFGIGSAEGTSLGDAASGTGNQGSPFGNSDQGDNEGVGGKGSFNLDGRSIGSGDLPLPAYTIQEEGRIVINITVDPKGNVINAIIGRGTNIDNASMRKSALEAAGRAKFNSINGANNQSGTITYIYQLR
ncbi:energy transducer TonB [Parabacteroides sp. PF5-9]|uniref:energy transducer TonB family protein n=1 Tax=Parabacteroides sp. PF5-9 TaxID=1742404 RepID=UPI002473CE23|nr:energy transducer TonB [Parabacteroides sp. PF5-9]MDH6358252.1 TonB family protein [Parabacteroides sp. PF5-9]